MGKRIPGTPLVHEGEWESEWAVKAPTLRVLKDLLGLPLLIEFCRCSVAADRLTSLGDFGLFNEKWRPRSTIAHGRNLQTMFWLVCGTLHEAIGALTEMEILGIEGLLGSLRARRPWIELRSTAARWNEDPIYQRARNKIAFHLDPSAIRKGICLPGRENEPVVWKRGNTRQERSTIFHFSQDCILSAILSEDATEEAARKRLDEFCGRIRDAHLAFSPWVQKLFMSAVRGAALGFKLVPRERPKSDALSPERLDAIGELAAAMPSDVKDAVLELLDEVSRLGGLLKRQQNDPGRGRAKRRRDDGEHRLRAIAATAKEFLVNNREASAEKRLRELLAIVAEP